MTPRDERTIHDVVHGRHLCSGYTRYQTHPTIEHPVPPQIFHEAYAKSIPRCGDVSACMKQPPSEQVGRRQDCENRKPALARAQAHEVVP